MKTIFSDIIENRNGHIIWEDSGHIAFLSPFPNTPGLTVLIPKINHGDYVFHLHEQEYIFLLKASNKVALILSKALGVSQVALVFECTGVPPCKQSYTRSMAKSHQKQMSEAIILIFQQNIKNISRP